MNPFASQKPQARPRQYEKPDPSLRQDCHEDRPIKINPTGRYNLNFIDLNNEAEAIMDADPYSYESPIHGLDAETYQRIMEEEFRDDELEIRG